MNYAPNWMTEPSIEVLAPMPANQNQITGPFERLRTAPEGTRNTELNQFAYRLFAAEKILGSQLVAEREQLQEAALACGLDNEEIHRTLRSAEEGAKRTPLTNSVPEQQFGQKPIDANAYVPKDPASLPKREFLYGTSYIRKYVSATVAPGGVGKSALTLLEAVLMASGRGPSGMPTGRPIKTWVFNLEDPLEELQRRVEGIRLHYDIPEQDIVGNLFLDSGRDQELIIAHQTRNGTIVSPNVENNLVDQLRENEIDVLIIDPFISCHMVPENDNGAIDAVVKAWGRIADRANVSIQLVHHTRKEADGGRVSIDSVRGGKAFADATRNARLLEPMTESVAGNYGVLNPQSHFGVLTGKESMAPQTNNTDWYEMVSVELGNGDSVGVPVYRQLNRVRLEPTSEQLELILDAIRNGDYRQNNQATEWVGKAIAEVLSLDYGSGLRKDQRTPSQKIARTQLIDLLNRLIAEETLQVNERTENGRLVKYVVVGSAEAEADTELQSTLITTNETQPG